jgi:hypothetical protein
MVNVQLGDYSTPLQSSVCSLGVHLDSQLTMKTHVRRICRSSFYQLRQLRSIRSSLSETSCSAPVHAFITSRLEYCNSLLAGIGDGLIAQLQSVTRVAARLVLRRNISSIQFRLTYVTACTGFLIRSRIDYKLGLLVYKCQHGNAPPYLVEMLQSKSEVPALRRLRSTARGDLVVPRTLTMTYYGPRSFSGASFWNSLPDHVRDHSLSIDIFKKETQIVFIPAAPIIRLIILHLLLSKRLRDCIRSKGTLYKLFLHLHLHLHG